MAVAVERGFVLVEPGWAAMRVLPEVFADTSVRMNEGGCDPQGRFYCGTMAYDAAPGAGTLFRLDPDESVHVVMNGVTVSNGLAWSPDGSTAYYVDTATQRIDAFAFDDATAAFKDRRTVVEIDPQLGGPDGLTVDAEGGLWVALWDGAAVHRYAPDGRLEAVIELPTPRVTACTFGGSGLDQLFITTSALGLSGCDEVAGAVFRGGARGRWLACWLLRRMTIFGVREVPPVLRGSVTVGLRLMGTAGKLIRAAARKAEPPYSGHGRCSPYSLGAPGAPRPRR